MPFKQFDRNTLKLKPLASRVSDIDLKVIMDVEDPIQHLDNTAFDLIANAIKLARLRNAEVILMYGAHVIRMGCSRYMIKLMSEGFVTHFATNGAGAIHDFEFALIGQTCESVAKYISEGQFGLWQETGLINDALAEGAKQGLGAGEAIGRYIWENDLPYKHDSVLAQAYRQQVPATVHIAIGSDIIHEHPNADGSVLGSTSYTDFLIYAETIRRINGGVFLNFGSAVTGPEVYLKCLAMARNTAKQSGDSITDITTAVFDLIPICDEDTSIAPPKTDPRYYFRPWKTILARTVADGGRGYYVCGSHEVTLPNLAKRLFRG